MNKPRKNCVVSVGLSIKPERLSLKMDLRAAKAAVLFCFGVHFFSLASASTSSSAAASQHAWQNYLQKIVEINSGTKNRAGIRQLKDFLVKDFTDLGLMVDEIKNGDYSVLVIQPRPDAQHANPSKTTSMPDVLFVGHLDTVFAEDSQFQKIQMDGDNIKGPGVIDMKGGIALMREIVIRLKNENPESLQRIKILLNDDEEIGSPGTAKILDQQAEGFKFAFVFEPGTEKGDIVRSQSGIRWIDVLIQGKAAHAGLEHSKGKNACVKLARLLPKLQDLTNYKNRFTVNVGVLKGGTVANVVCENAEARLDLRFQNEADAKRVESEIQKIIPKGLKEGFQIQFSRAVDIPSLPELRTNVLYEQLKNISKKQGIVLNGVHVGYVADSNHLQKVQGLNLIVGVGPFGKGMHSDQETLWIPSFEQRLNLLLEWFRH